MECVWIQFIVPNLVSKDVLQVNELLSNTVLELCSGKSHTEDNNVLNAPDYLFVSTNLAKMYPNLMESTIIMSYRSYLPGELSKKWNVGSTARISRNSMSSLRGAALVTTVVFLLQILATSPFVLQRLFVRFSQPFFLAGLVYIGSMVFKSPLYISIFSVSIAATVFLIVYRYLYHDRRLSNKLNSIVPDNEFTLNTNGNEELKPNIKFDSSTIIQSGITENEPSIDAELVGIYEQLVVESKNDEFNCVISKYNNGDEFSRSSIYDTDVNISSCSFSRVLGNISNSQNSEDDSALFASCSSSSHSTSTGDENG
jgi:hypothetical protein